METVDQGRFSCTKCAKSYKWKPELSGKKVKCKCGNVMGVPQAEPVVSEADDDLEGLYALAADERQSAARQREEPVGFRCPACNGDLAIGAVVCTGCGFNIKTGSRVTRSKPAASPRSAAPHSAAPRSAAPTLAYAGGGGSLVVPSRVAAGVPSAMAGFGRAKRGLQEDKRAEAAGIFQDLYLPIGLIVFGLIGSFLHQMHFQRYPDTFSEALLKIGIGLCIDLALIGVACVAAIKVMEVAFGSPGAAALKICAIAIAPDGISNIITYLLNDPVGLVGWFIAIGMYYALFHYLFDMDAGEVMMMTALVWIIRTWVGMLIAGALLAVLMSGGGAADALAKAAISDGSGSAAVSEDRDVQEVLDMYDLPEAQSWLDESKNRIFGETGRGDTEKLVKDLYAAGAKKIWVMKEGSVANAIYVVMPKDRKQRATIYQIHATTYGNPTPKKDTGDEYQTFRF